MTFKQEDMEQNIFEKEATVQNIITESGNGSKKLSTTMNVFVDDFGSLSKYCANLRPYNEVADTMELLWNNDPLMCLKETVYLRTISRDTRVICTDAKYKGQIGQGLKHEFINRLIWISHNHFDVFEKNLEVIFSVGSWKDVFRMLEEMQKICMVSCKVESCLFGLIQTAYLSNKDDMELIRKYMPAIKSSSNIKNIETLNRSNIGKRLAGFLFGYNDPERYKKYRLMKSAGKAHTWQQQISQGKYNEIDFNKISGRALMQMTNSKFLDNHGINKGTRESIAEKGCAQDDMVAKSVTGISRSYRKRTIPKLPSSFVAIDFETLYSQRLSVCSVGMVKFMDGVAVDRYYSLVRPPFESGQFFGPSVTWIHGFSEESVMDERSFAEIHDEVASFVGDLPLVAHNACVERACISECCEYYGIKTPLPYEDIFDTYFLSEQIEKNLDVYVKGAGLHTLDVLCERFGVKVLSHHNAQDDAEMCGNLFLKLGEVASQSPELVELHEIRPCTGKKFDPADLKPIEDVSDISENPFKGKKVVLTGFPKVESAELGHRLKMAGADVDTSVTKKTSFLITGCLAAGPSKLEKAEKLGVSVISQEDCVDMLNESGIE